MKAGSIVNLEDVDLKYLYTKWKENLKELKPFIRSTPFVSLQTYNNFDLDKYNIEESKNEFVIDQVQKIVGAKCDDETFMIVDLDFNEILDIAFILNDKEGICPLLNVNLMFHPYGIVGNKMHVKKLIHYGMNLKYSQPWKCVMFMPYDRYDDSIDVSKMTHKLNNQYGIGDEDIPYAETLKSLGYKKVVAVTYEKVKEDFNEYLKYISKELEVEKIVVNAGGAGEAGADKL